MNNELKPTINNFPYCSFIFLALTISLTDIRIVIMVIIPATYNPHFPIRYINV